MGKIKVAAFKPGAATKSGISIAVAASKSGQHVRIGLTAAAQEEFFGGVLNPETDAIDVMLTDEAGSTHLMGLRLTASDDPDGLPFSGGVRGSIALKLVPWTRIAEGKRPPVSLPVVNRQKNELVSVKLPDWARPAERKIGQGKSIME